MARAKILLIDDHRTVLRLLEAILRLKGYDLLYAENGRQGLALARQEHPDLILLDVMMPEIDGYKVCLDRLPAGWEATQLAECLSTLPGELFVPRQNFNAFMRLVDENGCSVQSIEPRRKSLEDFFLGIIQQGNS